MNSNATLKEVVFNNDTPHLPNGIYDGVWGGYEARVETLGLTFVFTTERGIRCVSCPCTLTINGYSVTVEVKPTEQGE